MRNVLTVCCLVGLQFVIGCQQPYQPNKESSQASTPKQEPLAPGSAHIDMPVKDIAVEMQKHCNAASKGYEDVKAKIDTAILHGDADEAYFKIKKFLPQLKTVQKDLEKCREMAHGVYEKSMGKEPPK